MPNKWQITALLAIAFGAFYVALILGWPSATPQDFLKLVSFSITATTLWLTVFHLFLWKYLPNFLAPRPNINGTWRVKGVPRSKGGKSIEAFDGFMFVKQHYFSMSMRLETAETCSELEVDQFTISKSGTYQLWATYFCEPHVLASPNSLRSHYGAFMLEYRKVEVSTQLKGRYWIDGEVANKQGKVSSGGSLVLYERKAKNYNDFESATTGYIK